MGDQTKDKLRNPWGVDHAANEIEHSGNADEVGNGERWTIAEALFGTDRVMSHDARDLFAVYQALGSAEAALRLVREAFGDEVQVDWFWNCCQGHYAEVTSDVDGMHRQGHAVGRSMALAIVAAALRYRLAEPERIAPPAGPSEPRTVSLRVVDSRMAPRDTKSPRQSPAGG